jgi:hypothetical protein
VALLEGSAGVGFAGKARLARRFLDMTNDFLLHEFTEAKSCDLLALGRPNLRALNP